MSSSTNNNFDFSYGNFRYIGSINPHQLISDPTRGEHKELQPFVSWLGLVFAPPRLNDQIVPVGRKMTIYDHYLKSTITMASQLTHHPLRYFDAASALHHAIFMPDTYYNHPFDLTISAAAEGGGGLRLMFSIQRTPIQYSVIPTSAPWQIHVATYTAVPLSANSVQAAFTQAIKWCDSESLTRQVPLDTHKLIHVGLIYLYIRNEQTFPGLKFVKYKEFLLRLLSNLPKSGRVNSFEALLKVGNLDPGDPIVELEVGLYYNWVDPSRLVSSNTSSTAYSDALSLVPLSTSLPPIADVTPVTESKE